VAFRQRLRELEMPELGQKHDALNSRTVRYLETLRGDDAPAVSQRGGDKSGDGTYAPRSVCDFRFMVMHTREVPNNIVADR
jgi:hypothetical protein